MFAIVEFQGTSLVVKVHRGRTLDGALAAPTATLVVHNYEYKPDPELPWWRARFTKRACIYDFRYRESRRCTEETLEAFLQDFLHAVNAGRVYWAYTLELRRDYPRWGHLEVLGLLSLLIRNP